MQLSPVNDFRVSNLSRRMAVDHYENFPVASILLPRRLVPAAEPGVCEMTMEVRIYRERPEFARHTKPVAQALWDFLRVR